MKNRGGERGREREPGEREKEGGGRGGEGEIMLLFIGKPFS